MSDGSNNVEILEQLIEELTLTQRDVVRLSTSIQESINELDKLLTNIVDIVESNAPVNTRKITPILDSCVDSFSALVNMKPIIDFDSKLLQAQSSLNHLKHYFENEYMMTVEEEKLRRGWY